MKVACDAAVNAAVPKLNVNPDGFDLNGTATLGAGSNGINPPAELTTLQIGTYSVTIPAGSFKTVPNGPVMPNTVEPRENCAYDLCRRAREESMAQQPSSGIRLVPRFPHDLSTSDAAALAN